MNKASEQFYLQDSRSILGNDMMWWRKGGAGYTSNLSEAEVFSREEAISRHRNRETDIPWPKDYIDKRTRPAVDVQYVDRAAIKQAGINLVKPKPPRKPSYRCGGCGVFMSERQMWMGPCERCECDNRP